MLSDVSALLSIIYTNSTSASASTQGHNATCRNCADIRLIFAYNSSMQLAAPQPRHHKVLMSFRYWNAWDVIFFDTDRMRTALPRRARFNSDEALIEFAQRAGGIKMSDDRQI